MDHDPDQEQVKIEELARKHGLTPEEGRVFLLFSRALHAYDELPSGHYDLDNTVVHDAIEHVYRVLAMRVAKRDHPDGWLTVGEEEERKQAEDLEQEGS